LPVLKNNIETRLKDYECKKKTIAQKAGNDHTLNREKASEGVEKESLFNKKALICQLSKQPNLKSELSLNSYIQELHIL
jgi:hypothetical protein